MAKHFLLILFLLLFGCGNSVNKTRMSDANLVVLENVLSPNKRFRILTYQFDTGASGYSRVFWAVTPESTQDLNISKFRLPDGHRAEGWTEQNDLIISKWQPYYYIQDAVELKTGDSFHEVKVKVIANDSSYPLGKANAVSQSMR